MTLRFPSGLGERIQTAMKGQGITQSKLADLIGTTQAAVSQWCNDKKAPSNLRLLAEKLGVGLHWLQTGEGAMKPVDERAERQAYLDQALWAFRPAPLDGGRDFGNSNVWSFDPALHIFVREVLQNVRDAALPGVGPVRVVFRLIQLRGEELARYKIALRWSLLEPHLRASVEQGQKLGTLLRDGLRQLDDSEELLLMVVEDAGTTGLLGPERGQGKFAALCRNNLDSNKEGSSTKGGAFGLGKAVLWRASRLATVMFSSNLSRPEGENSQLRLVGRCELSWHKLSSQEAEFAGPGWFGLGRTDEEPTVADSFWNNEALARDLYLDRKDVGSGTSVCVVGFHDPGADQQRNIGQMADDLKRATARHFFPALARGQMEVTIETQEGRRQTSSEVVRAEELQPDYWQMMLKLPTRDFNERLESEGDVVCTEVLLEVPKRKADPDPHEPCEHKALLLVRQAAEDDPSGRPRNELAQVRGPGMVVDFLSLGAVCLGARPFHAILLCGKAADDRQADVRADEFLRTAEPPAHNKWTMTPDLKTAYAHGAKAKLDRFLERVRETLRELVKPAARDLGDGPQSLRELFRLGQEPIASKNERPRVFPIFGKPDEQGRWQVEARVRLKPSRGIVRLRPAVFFVAETGGGQAVRWEKLEALDNCYVEEFDLIVPPEKRELRFRGVTKFDSQPVRAQESSIVIDIRKLVTGGRS